MKLLFLIPLIALCSCSTPHHITADSAVNRNFITVCSGCNATNTLKPLSSRTSATQTTPEGGGLLCTKTLTFRCVCCQSLFTQESEPIFEPIRPKALLAQ